jgi:hypothetical protein
MTHDTMLTKKDLSQFYIFVSCLTNVRVISQLKSNMPLSPAVEVFENSDKVSHMSSNRKRAQ